MSSGVGTSVDGFELLPLVGVAAGIGFWGWMFRDLWMNPDLPVGEKLAPHWPPASKYEWTYVFIVLNVVGAWLYYRSVYRAR